MKQTFANITFILLWLVRSTYCLLYEYEYDDPDLLYDDPELYDDPDLYDELDLNDEPERLAKHESLVRNMTITTIILNLVVVFIFTNP